MKIIKTKEDFKDKYIRLPKNLSRKKWDKIIRKLKKIGYVIEYDCRYEGLYLFNFLQPRITNSIINTFSYIIHIERQKEVSISDFLKEEEETIIEGYNCIPNKYMVFCGVGLRDSKEDVERSIQGFSYGKAKKFYNIIQALNWCFINPMKEITYETPCSVNSRTRYNEEKDSFENYNQELKRWTWNSYYRTSSPSLWKNIREYRKRKTDMVDSMSLSLGYNGKTRYTRLIGIDWGNINIKLNEFPILTTLHFKEIKLKEAVKRKINFKYGGINYKFNGDDILRTSGRLNEFVNYLNASELANLIINADEMVEIMESKNE